MLFNVCLLLSWIEVFPLVNEVAASELKQYFLISWQSYWMPGYYPQLNGIGCLMLRSEVLQSM